MCDNMGYMRRQGLVLENPNANESAALEQATSPNDRVLLASVEDNGAINDFEQKDLKEKEEKNAVHAHKTSHGAMLDPRFTHKVNHASLAENPEFDKLVAEQEEAAKEALKMEQEWSTKEKAQEAAIAKEHRATSPPPLPLPLPQKQPKTQMLGSDHDRPEIADVPEGVVSADQESYQDRPEIAEVSEGVVSADQDMLLQVSSSSSASHEKPPVHAADTAQAKHVSKGSFIQSFR